MPEEVSRETKEDIILSLQQSDYCGIHFSTSLLEHLQIFMSQRKYTIMQKCFICLYTLNTSLTAIMSSGPTPSPGNNVTLKVLSARAGGVSEAFGLAERLSERTHTGLMAAPLRPWVKQKTISRG